MLNKNLKKYIESLSRYGVAYYSDNEKDTIELKSTRSEAIIKIVFKKGDLTLADPKKAEYATISVSSCDSDSDYWFIKLLAELCEHEHDLVKLFNR